jgi:hypothetical protein
VRANRCLLESCGRSAVVMFGESHLLLSNSTISDAGVHGICARGQVEGERERERECVCERERDGGVHGICARGQVEGERESVCV